MAENINNDVASKKVIGMPVYSCQEGLYLGNIRQILIDSKLHSVQGFVLERRRLGKEERILPFAAVHNFGEDGVTVETAGSIERRGQNSRYIRALRHPVTIIGSRVFTTAGRTLGKIDEYRFDSTSGQISGLEIAPNGFFKVRSLVRGEYIIAIAGRTVMLKDSASDDAVDIENSFLVNMGNAAGSVKAKATELFSNTADMTKRISSNINEKIDHRKKRDSDLASSMNAAPTEEAAAIPSSSPQSATTQRQTSDDDAAVTPDATATNSAGAINPDATVKATDYVELSAATDNDSSAHQHEAETR